MTQNLRVFLYLCLASWAPLAAAQGVFGLDGGGTGSHQTSSTPMPAADAPVSYSAPSADPRLDLERIAQRIREIDAILFDLDRTFGEVERRLQQDPRNPELLRMQDELARARVQLTGEREQLIATLERRGGGAASGAPSRRMQSPWIQTSELVARLPRLRGAVYEGRQGLRGDDGRPLPASADPSSQQGISTYLVVLDAVLDIRDPALRAAVHDAFMRTLQEPGLDAAFADLITAVGAAGYDRATPRTPEVARALAEVERNKGGSELYFHSEEYIAELLSGRRASEGIRMFGDQPVEYDVWRKANSSMLDGLTDPDGVPPSARAAWREATLAFARFHRELAWAQRLSRNRHTGNYRLANSVRVRESWNAYVAAFSEYIRAYGHATGRAPLRSRTSLTVVGAGQAPPGAVEIPGYGAGDGGLFGTDGGATSGGGTGAGSGTGAGTPGAGAPPTGAPDQAEIQTLYQRIRRHRQRVKTRLTEIAEFIKGDQWRDESAGLGESLQFWRDNTPAERFVTELKDETFHPRENLTGPKSLVGMVSELASIEKDILAKGWLFPTRDRIRRAGESDRDLGVRISQMPPYDQYQLMVGTFLVLARQEAFAVMALAQRFQTNRYTNLDSLATGKTEDVRKTFERLFLVEDESAGDNAFRYRLDHAAAAAEMRKKISYPAYTGYPGPGYYSAAGSASSGCEVDDQAILRGIDEVVRLFAGDAGAAAKVKELRESWRRCRATIPLLSQGERALAYQEETGEPLDAYRAILLQVAVRR